MKVNNILITVVCVFCLFACRSVKKMTHKEASVRTVKIDSAAATNSTTLDRGRLSVTTEKDATSKRTVITERVYIYDTIRGRSYLDKSTTTTTEETKEQAIKREEKIDSLVKEIAHSTAHSFTDTAAVIKELNTKDIKSRSFNIFAWVGLLLTGVIIVFIVRFLYKRFVKSDTWKV